jgi:hypothetical protein
MIRLCKQAEGWGMSNKKSHKRFMAFLLDSKYGYFLSLIAT